jgi:hypothetical protein
MRTSVEFIFDGHELYGRDSCPLKKVFIDAIKDAQQLAAERPNLSFELRRRWIEMGEYQDMLRLVSSDLPNTMVVVSDFPLELMQASYDVGGYNTQRKQTMLRVISSDGEGHITVQTQSLDGSNRLALENIYQSLSFEPEPGELLGQRLHLDLPPDEQAILLDKLTAAYDQSLSNQYGGRWHGGRREAGLNTYDFVIAQQDLLADFMNRSNGQFSETLLYQLAENMSVRLGTHETGRPYSGCGITIGAPETPTSADQLQDAGYGNRTSEESKYGFDKKMHCVVCQSPPKKGETKKMCGPCGICRSCDARLKSKSR